VGFQTACPYHLLGGDLDVVQLLELWQRLDHRQPEHKELRHAADPLAATTTVYSILYKFYYNARWNCPQVFTPPAGQLSQQRILRQSYKERQQHMVFLESLQRRKLKSLAGRQE
jgi:hypothetical protein